MDVDWHTKGKFISLIWQGGDEDIEGAPNFLDTRKGALKKLGGGAAKICILQNQQKVGEAPKKLNR